MALTYISTHKVKSALVVSPVILVIYLFLNYLNPCSPNTAVCVRTGSEVIMENIIFGKGTKAIGVGEGSKGTMKNIISE